MKNKHFTYKGNSGIVCSTEFAKKKLAQYHVNIGCLCKFSCSYCYVPSMMLKLKSLQDFIQQGNEINSFSLYREPGDAETKVRKSLFYKNGCLRNAFVDNKDTVFFCTTCDPCATDADVATTEGCIRLILENTKMNIRVLSKSHKIWDLANHLTAFKTRVVYGLSTGTNSDKVSNAIEGEGTLPVNQRIALLNKLQGEGFRTFGMLCPVLPGDIARFAEIVQGIKADKCEDIWVEAVNPRGKNFAATIDALKSMGVTDDALQLEEVVQSRIKWQDYCKKLFETAVLCIPSGKLKFLQYTKRGGFDFTEWFKKREIEGAIVL